MKLHVLIVLLIAGGTLAAAQEMTMPATTTSAPAVADVGSRRLFWFNSQVLFETADLVRACQANPVRHPRNPILVADKPWEGTLVQLYSPDVHFDPATGQWQMWYEGHPDAVLLCTAFSKDGLEWTKPKLGLEEWKGSRDNNIILQTGYWDAHAASIVKAPNEKDPARRYKLYYWVGPGWYDQKNPFHARIGREKVKPYRQNGHYVAFSEDGVRFTPHLEAPALANCGDYASVQFDPRLGKYVAYYKIDRKLPGWDISRRCMSMAQSDDGVSFGPPVHVLAPDAEDDALAKRQALKRVEFYGLHVWGVEDFYLGLAWVFRVSGGNDTLGRGWDDGRIEPQLIYSPDGRDWKRLPVREPFIPHGPAGSFESGSIYTAGDRPVLVGDELRFYYFGVSYTHGDYEAIDSPRNLSGVGLATLPRDRYVAWLAGAAEATMITRPLRFAGRGLHLNLDASRGQTRVALLDERGQELPGYALADCVPLTADGLDQVVSWRGGGDLSALAGKPVRLKLSLRHSALYTVQFR